VAIQDKVTGALRKALLAPYVHLDTDDGVSGFVVSPSFRGMSALDRQGMIEAALTGSDEAITPEELRHVLVVAALTPEEFNSVGAPIRVHKIKKMTRGGVEITLRGNFDDANYVRNVFAARGIQASPPTDKPGTRGILVSFKAIGPRGDPLTERKAVEILNSTPYVEVVSNASVH
jgi:acid stress-induced BolA-like protein IbaG/YrbA